MVKTENQHLQYEEILNAARHKLSRMVSFKYKNHIVFINLLKYTLKEKYKEYSSHNTKSFFDQMSDEELDLLYLNYKKLETRGLPFYEEASKCAKNY